MAVPQPYQVEELYRLEPPEGIEGTSWLEQVWNDIQGLEARQPEGQRLEVQIVFREVAGLDGSIEWVVRQLAGGLNLANELVNVDKWPENDQLAYAFGNVLSIRWYKNPLWWATIKPVLMGLLVVIGVALGLIVVAIALNGWKPLPPWVWLLIGVGFFVAAAGPSFFEVVESYYQERTAYREVQKEALEALQG